MEIKATPEFRSWLDGLKDKAGRARIQARIERLAEGNPGRHRHLKGGVRELKLTVGPGYRVYYTVRAEVLIILLCGGDKSTQRQDIEKAQRMSGSI